MLKLSQIRQLAKIAADLEADAAEKPKFVNDKYLQLFHVEYQDSEGVTKTISVRDSGNPEPYTAYVAQMTDGSTAIYLDYFRTDKSLFKAIIAHEIGHLNEKHFEKKATSYISENLRKQKLYYEKYVEHKRQSDIKAYSTAVYIGLLREGVFDIELGADIEALNYVTKEQLITLHSAMLSRCGPVAKMEKVNRLKILSSIEVNPPSRKFKVILLDDFMKQFINQDELIQYLS